MEVTGRDIETLRWVGRWWGVTVAQVDRWWRQPPQSGLHGPSGPPRIEVVRRRLAAMQAGGLVAVHRMPTSPAHIFAITRDGLALAGLETWSVPRWRWSQFRHEHTATDIALDLLEVGFEVVPERVMRQDDALGVGSWSLVLPTDRGARTHYPDLWVRPDDGGAAWRAVEVELSRKSLTRLATILAAYRDRGCGVTYYTSQPTIARAVRQTGERVRLADLDIRRIQALDVDARPAGAAVGVGHG